MEKPAALEVPIRGYTRLSIQTFKAWQILGFLLALGILAALIFPRQEMLVSFYVKKGLTDKALEELHRILKKDPRNISALLMVSELLEKKGEIPRSIKALERASRYRPGDPEILERLVHAYEWDRRPEKALRTLETLAVLRPDRLQVFSKLIDYYRYLGRPDMEVDAIVSFIRAAEKRPVEEQFPQLHLEGLEERILRNTLFTALTTEMESLSGKWISGPKDPLLGELLKGLYLLRFNEARTLALARDEREAGIGGEEGGLTRALELFVSTGKLEVGEEFAAYMDRAFGKGYDSRMKFATVLRWNGFSSMALKIVQALDRQFPGNPEILMALAETAREAGNFRVALAASRKLLKHRKDASDIYLLALREAFEAAPGPREAYPLARELAERSKGESSVVLELLDIALATGDLGIVEEAVGKAVSLKPGDPKILERAGEIYLWTGKPRKAYAVLKMAVEGSPGGRETLETLLDAAEATRDRGILESALSLARKQSPGDIRLLKRIGETYLSIGRPERAYSVFKRIAALQPKSRANTLRMLDAAEAWGKEPILSEAVLLARKRHPGDARLILRVAEMFLGLGKERRAINAYRDYLRLKPKDEEALRQLAKLYLWNNQGVEAARLFLALAKDRPRDLEIQREAALYCEEAGLPEEAYAIYSRLHQAHPENSSFTENLIRLALWTNRPGEAARLRGEISDGDPSDYRKAVIAGKSYLEAGRPLEGVRYLERARKLRAGDPSLLRMLIQAYEWTGDTGKMIQTLEILAASGGIEKEEVLLLARAYLDRGDGQRALKYLQSFGSSKVLDREEGMMLARAYELTGKERKALEVYRCLAKEYPGDSGLLAELGNRALWLDMPESALRFFEKALRVDPANPEALKGSAEVYAMKGDLQRAIRRLEAYNRIRSDDYEARYRLGELYFQSQRQGEALREYDKALSLMREADLRLERSAQGMSLQ